MNGGLRARKRQSTRDAIEAAALDLFAKHGFDNVTVDDIATAADVSRATVFRHVGSKEDTVLEVQHGLLVMLLDEIRRNPGRPLAEALVGYAATLDTDADRLRVRAKVIASHPALLERLSAIRTQWDAAVAATVAELDGRAETTLEDLTVSAATVSALFVAFLTWAVAEGVTLQSLVAQAAAALPGPVTPSRPDAKKRSGRAAARAGAGTPGSRTGR